MMNAEAERDWQSQGTKGRGRRKEQTPKQDATNYNNDVMLVNIRLSIILLMCIYFANVSVRLNLIMFAIDSSYANEINVLSTALNKIIR